MASMCRSVSYLLRLQQRKKGVHGLADISAELAHRELRRVGFDEPIVLDDGTKLTTLRERGAGRLMANDVRLSDIEPRSVCKACGKRGADVRPHFESARMGTTS